jgi:hypothetical protein
MKRLCVVLAIAALTSCGTIHHDPLEGRGEAPTGFSFTTFEGEEFSADQHRGVPVVLNFWESW